MPAVLKSSLAAGAAATVADGVAEGIVDEVTTSVEVAVEGVAEDIFEDSVGVADSTAVLEEFEGNKGEFGKKIDTSGIRLEGSILAKTFSSSCITGGMFVRLIVGKFMKERNRLAAKRMKTSSREMNVTDRSSPKQNQTANGGSNKKQSLRLHARKEGNRTES